MDKCNEERCTCPKTECENHGTCCKCIEHHRAMPLSPVVFCLRELIDFTPKAQAPQS